MACYLCSSEEFKIVHNGVRDNPKINVIECQNCGLVSLDQIEHITKNFYENSGMHSSKIKIENWQKETFLDDNRRFNDLYDSIFNKNVLDFGSGNGGFLKFTKNVAKNSFGIEIEKKFQPYFKNNNIIVFESIENLHNTHKIKFDLITAFHVFEHLKNPISEIKKLNYLLKNDGKIIIEVPNSDDALISLYKSKAFKKFTYWSQHLFLYNETTIKSLVEKADMKVNYIKQIQRYPISNHLYWLSKKKPGGHIKWNFFGEKFNAEYVEILKKNKICDTISVCISKN